MGGKPGPNNIYQHFLALTPQHTQFKVLIVTNDLNDKTTNLPAAVLMLWYVGVGRVSMSDFQPIKTVQEEKVGCYLTLWRGDVGQMRPEGANLRCMIGVCGYHSARLTGFHGEPEQNKEREIMCVRMC